MKIVNIAEHYYEGYSYQDNYLPKYHKKIADEVTVISSKWIRNDKGEIEYRDEKCKLLDDGVKLIRLDYERRDKKQTRLGKLKDIYKVLEFESPDIIFLHGIQTRMVIDIIKYQKKHLNVKIYADNHADYSNSATNFISKYFLHGILWKHYVKKLEPYTEKIWGVLPARVDILSERYNLNKNKCDLLVMGADDELINEAKKTNARKYIREKYNIKENEFLIVTGGKIDLAKTQVLDLMKVIKNKYTDSVKLIVFGSVVPDLKTKFEKLVGDNVIYIGWKKSDDLYKYIESADLAIYPGRHSVLWEQTVAQGIPMVVKYWKGTKHIDIGGNVRFILQNNEENIDKILDEIIRNDDFYREMKNAAKNEKKDMFLYSEISKRSIEFEDLYD